MFDIDFLPCGVGCKAKKRGREESDFESGRGSEQALRRRGRSDGGANDYARVLEAEERLEETE